MKSAALNEIKLHGRVFQKVASDPVKSAEVLNLEYVDDRAKGITRKKVGKSFRYYLDNKILNDQKILARIKDLVIPPAWENVWICSSGKGHLQATGLDQKKRKQYRYHHLWNQFRNETKFYRLFEFGKTLPAIREQLEKDVSRHGLPLEKVLATAVIIMQQTDIRVGNSMYEKLYGSYGLTTLKDGHVNFIGNETFFTFKGKKGVKHCVSLKSRRLTGIIRRCLDLPGKELFQYYTGNGEVRSIDSGMVNAYIHRISGKNFSSKDFRTWEGSVHAIEAIMEIETESRERSIKRNVVEILDRVSAKLGNTRSVCRKYYVHPFILKLYESGNFSGFLKNPAFGEERSGKSGLLPAEKLLMKILKTDSHQNN